MSNAPTGSVATIIQALIFQVGIDAVIAYSDIEFPFLTLPLVSQIYRFAVTKIVGVLYAQVSQFVAFSIIDFQTQAEQDTYNKAVENLRAAYLNASDGVDLEKAKEDFVAALKSLIHFDSNILQANPNL